MKKLILLLSFINLFNHASAQTKSIKTVDRDRQWLGIKYTVQGNELTKGGFDALNAELQKSQVNTLPTFFLITGASLNIWANQRTGFEFAYQSITSKLEENDKFIYLTINQVLTNSSFIIYQSSFFYDNFSTFKTANPCRIA